MMVGTATLARGSDSTSSVGKLRLVLRSGPRAGQVVALAALRVSIGSAPDCTLRLRASGIEPLHCVIVRSGGQAIVRSLAGATWLNGEAVDHALLAEGDLLGIGPIEFEVLDGAGQRPVWTPREEPAPAERVEQSADEPAGQLPPPSEEARQAAAAGEEQGGAGESAPTAEEAAAEPEAFPANLPDDPPLICLPEEPLEQREALGDARVVSREEVDCGQGVSLPQVCEQQPPASEPAASERPDLVEHQEGFLKRCEVWFDEQRDALALLAAHAQQMDERLALVQQLEHTLDGACGDWRTGLDQVRAELIEHAARVEQSLAELRQQYEAFAGHQQEWPRHWQFLQASLAERLDRIDEHLARLDARSELIERLQRQRVALEHSLANERAEPIDHRLAELRAQREAFEQYRHATGERAPGCVENARQIEQRLAELHSERRADDAPQQQDVARGSFDSPDSEMAEADSPTAEHQAAADPIVDRQPASEAVEDEPRALDDAGTTAVQTEEGQPEGELDAGEETFTPKAWEAETEAELDDEPEDITSPWADRLLAPRRREEEDAAGLDEESADQGVEPSWEGSSEPDEAEETSPERDAEPTDAAGVEFQEVSANAPLETARLFPHLYGEGEDQTADGEKERARLESLTGMHHATEQGAGPGEEEEESIEQYMARLLQRIRGTTGEPGGEPVASAPARTPSSSPAPAQPDEPPPRPASPIDLSQLTPRAVAPELPTNLSLMRDLANQSARTALDLHARRRLNGEIQGKLIVTAAALTSASLLAWLSIDGNSLTFYAAVISTVVALLWGTRYLVLTGHRLFQPDKGATGTPEK